MISKDIESLRGEIEDVDYKIENIGIDNIKSDLKKIADFRNKKHRMFSEIQQSRSKIEATEAKIELLKNEIATSEAKVQEYEDNRHVIENLSALLGEQKAVKVGASSKEDLVEFLKKNKI